MSPGAGGHEAPSCEVSQRIIVFIIGGVTYSELRVAAEVMKDLRGVEVIMGGTSVLTPRRLIDILRPKRQDEGNPFESDEGDLR